MSTEVTAKEKRLFDVLVNHASSIDWLGIAAAFEADASSGEYVDKAMQLIPKGTDDYFRFKEAVLKSIPNAKCIHHHWLVKALASILQPDYNGNVVSPLLVLLVSQQMGKSRYAN